MDRLLAYRGPVVHVDHSHRLCAGAPTGVGGMRSGWAVAAAGAQQMRVNRLENDVFMLSKKIEELGGQVSDARTREFRDKVKRSMCDAQVGKLRGQIRTVKETLREIKRKANEDEAAAAARLKATTAEVAKAEAEVAEAEARVQAVRAEVKALETQVAELRSDLNDKTAEASLRKEEVNQLQDMQSTQQEAIRALGEKFREADAEANKWREKAAKNFAQTVLFKKYYFKAKQVIDTMEEEARVAAEESAKKDDDLSAKQRTIDELQEKAKKFKDMENQIKILRATLKAYEGDKKEWVDERDRLRNDVQRVEGELQRAKASARS